MREEGPSHFQVLNKNNYDAASQLDPLGIAVFKKFLRFVFGLPAVTLQEVETINLYF